jgi:phosphoglycolate phosphatase
MENRPLHRITQVIFDLDGTVWDSAPGILSAIRHTLGTWGVPVPAEAELRGSLGPPLAQMLTELGVPDHEVGQAVTVYRQHYAAVGEFDCAIYPGILDLLASLREQCVALATATSKGREATLRMLEHFDLSRHFDVIEAASMTARGSEKSEVIQAAITQLGPTTGRRLMIGDRKFDIEGGTAHGLETVWVTWGYGSEQELAASRPDHVASSPQELGRLLLVSPAC